MLFSFLSMPLLVLLSYVTGCHLTAYLQGRRAELAICHALLTGFTILVVTLTLLSAFLPVGVCAMPLTGVLVLSVLIHQRGGPTSFTGRGPLVQVVRSPGHRPL
jgi:hypothetical protein